MLVLDKGSPRPDFEVPDGVKSDTIWRGSTARVSLLFENSNVALVGEQPK